MSKTKSKTANKVIHATREDWLMAAIKLAAPRFEENDTPLPKKLRASCSFMAGVRGDSVIGQHFPVSMSADEHHEVIVHPSMDDPHKVLATLIHELCHAAAPAGEKHGPRFTAIARALLLEGKPTATFGGDEFRAEITEPFVAKLGKYPHGALMTRGRKQTTRMVKCQCESCGYIARVSSGTLNAFGPPICPNPDCADGYDEENDRLGHQPVMAEVWNHTNA